MTNDVSRVGSPRPLYRLRLRYGVSPITGIIHFIRDVTESGHVGTLLVPMSFGTFISVLFRRDKNPHLRRKLRRTCRFIPGRRFRSRAAFHSAAPASPRQLLPSSNPAFRRFPCRCQTRTATATTVRDSRRITGKRGTHPVS